MYIYKITNNLNGNSYIGLKTSTVEESESYYGSGKLIAKAIQKYGKENFTKEILERNISDFDLLCEREKYYIKLYDTKINGYNMTDGGLGSLGYEPTEEHRNNMSLSLRLWSITRDGLTSFSFLKFLNTSNIRKVTFV